MSLDLSYVREQLPGLENGWTFFDNAGGSQILKPVVERINDCLFYKNAQTGGSYEISLQTRGVITKGREALATMMNASRPEEVIFGSSSTVLLQNLARAMTSQLKEGDEIIVTNSDHEANIGPWVRLAEKGVVVKFWDVNPETYELEIGTLTGLMTDKTRLVCVTQASNILGTINPIKEITKAVHMGGAQICVDGVAFAPHRAIDVIDWDVDYYVFSLYKTYGPHYAAMYGKYDLLLELDNLYHYFYSRESIPDKLQPRNTNYELVHGSAGIIDYLSELAGRQGAPARSENSL